MSKSYSKHIDNQSDYINVPLSIINNRWFLKGDEPIRAWYFYAWDGIKPLYSYAQQKRVKNHTFDLKAGETICTRSYLADKVGFSLAAAKSATNKLKRLGSIKVQQMSLSKDLEKKVRNSVSKIIVSGIPMPDEPYIQLYFPIAKEDFWGQKYIAKLYTYLMCKAAHKNTYIIGKGGESTRIGAGDILVNYKELQELLGCTESQLKRTLRILESAKAISRQRLGNRGILVHLNHYVRREIKKQHAEEVKPAAAAKAAVQSSGAKTADVQNVSVEKVAGNDTQTAATQQFKSDKENSTVVQSPVTEAVSYLFFELKKNRNINRLNEIITDVDRDLPSGFPMERLHHAVECYYDHYKKEKGDPPISSEELLKFFRYYQQQYYAAMVRREEGERKVQEKVETMKKTREFFEKSWEQIHFIHNNIGTDADCITRCSEQAVAGIAHELRRLIRDMGLQLPSRQLPCTSVLEGWPDHTKEIAATVNGMLFTIKEKNMLGSMYNYAQERMQKDIACLQKEINCLTIKYNLSYGKK